MSSGERGVKKLVRFMRLAEQTIETGRDTGAASNFASFWKENQRIIIC